MSTSAPIPELAANRVLNEISDFAAKRTAPDEFTFRRLEKEAKSSLAQDPAIAYTALGALNAVSGNEELMRLNHQKAISYRDDYLIRNNFAISLQVMGFMHEASEEYRQLVSRDPGNLKALQDAISRTWQSGELLKASAISKEYNKLVPDSKNEIKEEYVNLENAADLQIKLGISDDQVSNLVKIACQYARQHGFPILGSTLESDDDDSYQTLSLSILLEMPNKEIWAHNRQLFEVMMNEVPDQSAHLSVRFDRANFENEASRIS